MTIGDALFARLALRGFSKITAETTALQARISSGVNDPRPSADPARAVELSALREVRARLETRADLARDAGDRLALTDQTLSVLTENVRGLKQIALRAANDALTPEAHAALRIEAITLRASMLAAANASDIAGRPLFSGSAPGPAFVDTLDGVRYRGDAAPSQAALGDRLILPTGLPGAQVFGDDASGIFAMADDLIRVLSDPMLSARPELRAENGARLMLERGRDDQAVEVTLTGPLGSARLRLDLRHDAPGDALRVISDVEHLTGIRAEMAPDGRSVLMFAQGQIALTDQQGGPQRSPVLSMGQIDPDTQATTRPILSMRPAHLSINEVVARADEAVARMANARAAAGSLGAAVDRQKDSVAQQKLVVEQSVSAVQDLDVAAAITRLQSLLLSEQAAQQTFVKITSQSLFNYLR